MVRMLWYLWRVPVHAIVKCGCNQPDPPFRCKHDKRIKRTLPYFFETYSATMKKDIRA
jgi:hypothetical protein